MGALSGLQTALAVVALAALILGPGGAAWVAVKVGLNGARRDISETKDTCQRMDAKLNTMGERVARVETQHEDTERRVSRLEDAAA